MKPNSGDDRSRYDLRAPARFVASFDRVTERFTQSAAVLFAGAALFVVALEWFARQLIGSNVLFAWIEIGTLSAALAAAFALPSVRPAARSGLDSGAPDRAPTVWHALLLGCVALIVTIAFAVFSLTGNLHDARSHFFPWLTLEGPFVVIAVCAALWLLRCATRAADSRRSSSGEASGESPELAVIAVLLAGSIVVMALRAQSFAGAASLLGQTFWGVVADDAFLALALVCVLIESLREIHRAREVSSSLPCPSAFFSGVTADATTPSSSGVSSMSARALGVLLPTGCMVLTVGLLLGARPSEALAAMGLPAAVLGIIAAAAFLLHGYVSRASADRAGGSVSRPALRLRTEADVALVGIAVFAGLLVVMGYARLVEALAVPTVATTAVLARFAWFGRMNARRLAAAVAARIGFLVLYAFAGACMYIASDMLGLQHRFSDGVTALGVNLYQVAALAMVLAALLSSWLSPLGVAVCLLPAVAPAMHAAGAGLYQTLVVYCATVAAGSVIGVFVAADGRGRYGPWLLLFAVLAVVFLLTASPQASAYLPEHVRLW